jgi:hypothetical protein
VVTRMMAKPDVIAGFVYSVGRGWNRDVEVPTKSSRVEQAPSLENLPVRQPTGLTGCLTTSANPDDGFARRGMFQPSLYSGVSACAAGFIDGIRALF